MTFLLSRQEDRTVGTIEECRPEIVAVLDYIAMMIRRYEELGLTI